MTDMSSSESPQPESWITSFCSLLGHEYFAEVSEDFIEDDFNLTGLQSQVPMYKEALEMILDVEPEDDDEELEEEEEDEDEDDDNSVMRDEHGNRLDEAAPGGIYRSSTAAAAAAQRRHARMASDLSVIESSAELLYGLIHQRYITSRPGIQQMAEKYSAKHFGHCPRVFCNSTSVLPVGCHDTPGIDTVKLFCPSCLDVYTPPNSRFQSVDGAFFGTTFGCLFMMTFPETNIAPDQDFLNLATTHPIFSTTSNANPTSPTNADPTSISVSAAATNTGIRPGASRSSSLTSTTNPLTNATSSTLGPTNTNNNGTPNPTSTSQIPPDWLPPANQPTTINGLPTSNFAPGLGPGKIYESKIYGFRVSERAKTGPRMKWLRSRPVDVTELDEVGRFGGSEEEEEEEEIEEEGGEETEEAEVGGMEVDALDARGNEGVGGASRRKKAPLPKGRRSTGGVGDGGVGAAGAGGGGGGSGGRVNGVVDTL